MRKSDLQRMEKYSTIGQANRLQLRSGQRSGQPAHASRQQPNLKVKFKCTLLSHKSMNHSSLVIETRTVLTLDRVYLRDIFGISDGTIIILISCCQGILNIWNDIWNYFLNAMHF